MQAGSAMKIERGVDHAASATLACAAAYAAFAWFARQSAQPLLAAEVAAVAALAYVLSARVLSAIEGEGRKLPISVFDVREIEPIDPPELLLTDRHQPVVAPELLLTDRLEPAKPTSKELVLDDILAELGPDSRVVRLFDPAAMPTPGQLNDRIERHLVRDAPPGSSHDASQALHEALAELRRSLR
jgi:hypothetical protein